MARRRTRIISGCGSAAPLPASQCPARGASRFSHAAATAYTWQTSAVLLRTVTTLLRTATAKGYSSNEHHLENLLRARDSKKIPQFLKLETPNILNSAIFPQAEIASLRTEFCNALDKTSEELLALTIKASNLKHRRQSSSKSS